MYLPVATTENHIEIQFHACVEVKRKIKCWQFIFISLLVYWRVQPWYREQWTQDLGLLKSFFSRDYQDLHMKFILLPHIGRYAILISKFRCEILQRQVNPSSLAPNNIKQITGFINKWTYGYKIQFPGTVNTIDPKIFIIMTKLCLHSLTFTGMYVPKLLLVVFMDERTSIHQQMVVM